MNVFEYPYWQERKFEADLIALLERAHYLEGIGQNAHITWSRYHELATWKVAFEKFQCGEKYYLPKNKSYKVRRR